MGINQCTHPKCQATNGCTGACSKTAPTAWAEITKEYVAVSDEPFQNAIPLYAAPVHASDISQERVDETAKREHEFEEMVKRGTKAWADTPDEWVDELRGGVEKREWVGLTDEEIHEYSLELWPSESTFENGAKWAEAKLKEKNT
jgi:hypothetical protein